MTMLEKQRQKEAAPQRMVFPPPKQRNAWVAFGAVFVGGAALAIAIAFIVTSGSTDEPAPAVEVGPAVTIYTAEDRALMAAVAGGLVPAEALETDLFKTKKLVNQGYLPASILWPDLAPLYTVEERAFLEAAAATETDTIVPSIYSREEQALMTAVANGLVPAEVLETDLFKTKRLVNQGILPASILDPMPPPPADAGEAHAAAVGAE